VYLHFGKNPAYLVQNRNPAFLFSFWSLFRASELCSCHCLTANLYPPGWLVWALKKNTFWKVSQRPAHQPLLMASYFCQGTPGVTLQPRGYLFPTSLHTPWGRGPTSQSPVDAWSLQYVTLSRHGAKVHLALTHAPHSPSDQV
jgi:hypothetical protein